MGEETFEDFVKDDFDLVASAKEDSKQEGADSLETLASLVDEMERRERGVEDAELELASRKRLLAEISERAIPVLLSSKGLSEIRLADGRKVKVREAASVSIPDEKRAEFTSLLATRNALDLIKFRLAFDRMGDADREKLFAAVNTLGLKYEAIEKVEPATAAKFIRDLIGVGLDEEERFEGFASGKLLRVEDVRGAANVEVFMRTTVEKKKEKSRL